MSPSREVCCSQCATARSASRHWPVSRPPARGVVGAGAGVARLPLEVAEARVHRLHDHLVDLGDQARPVPLAVRRPRPRGPGARSRPGRRGRSRSTSTATGSGRRTAGSAAPRGSPGPAAPACAPPWPAARRPAARHRCRRPSCRRPAAAPAACHRGPSARRTAGRRVTLDHLARGEAERLRARTPPAARRLTALLARLDVITGRVHRQGRVDLLPHVVQVVALAQRADNSQRLPPPRRADGTDHEHQMVRRN